MSQEERARKRAKAGGPLPALAHAPKLDTKKQSPSTTILESSNLLGELLLSTQPLSSSEVASTIQDFMATRFRQQAYHVPAPPAEQTDDASPLGVHPRMRHVVEHLFDLDPEQILEHTASENIFVWLIDKDSPMKKNSKNGANGKQQEKSTPPLIRSIEVGDAETAFALYRSGHATYCRAPTFLEEKLVPALLRETGLGCGQYDNSNKNPLGTHLARGEIEIFMSSTIGHVTDWHYDFQENFTLQLSGRKKWYLKQSTVQHTLQRGCTPHYNSKQVVEGQLLAARLASKQSTPLFQFGPPSASDNHNSSGRAQEVILNPGDVMYFPAGMWHKVEVIEPGVSLNISLMATNYATLTCQALQHLLLQRSPAWRQTILTKHYEQPNQPTALIQLQQLLENDLPLALRELIDNQGGATALLPPGMRGPGRPGTEEKPDESNDVDIHEDEDPQNDENEEVEESDMESEVEAEPLIDIVNTSPPATGDVDYTSEALQQKLTTHRLVRNPLATLMATDDIVRYYKQKSASDSEDGADADTSKLYVLNFCFAGNEAHESVLRTTLSFTVEDRLDKLFASEADADKNSKRWIQSSSESLVNALSWLVHLGYLVWVERMR